jgi:hypothetical protein
VRRRPQGRDLDCMCHAILRCATSHRARTSMHCPSRRATAARWPPTSSRTVGLGRPTWRRSSRSAVSDVVARRRVRANRSEATPRDFLACKHDTHRSAHRIGGPPVTTQPSGGQPTTIAKSSGRAQPGAPETPSSPARAARAGVGVPPSLGHGDEHLSRYIDGRAVRWPARMTDIERRATASLRSCPATATRHQSVKGPPVEATTPWGHRRQPLDRGPTPSL